LSRRYWEIASVPELIAAKFIEDQVAALARFAEISLSSQDSEEF
jgi:hypothetical protein